MVEKKQLIKHLVCPYCLADRLNFELQKIICSHCQKEYKWSENQAPLLTIFQRAKPNQMASHKPSEGMDWILDVGAGARQEGTFNIDIRPLPGISVVCNGLYLPFRDQTFKRVLCNQMLEHVRYSEAVQLLTELQRVIKPCGVIEIWTPNFQALGILIAWISGNIDFSNAKSPSLYSPLTGLQEYPENVHMAIWNLKLLKHYAERSGIAIEVLETQQKYFGKGRKIKKAVSMLLPKRRGQLYLRGRKLPEGKILKDLKLSQPTDVWKDCPPHITYR